MAADSKELMVAFDDASPRLTDLLAGAKNLSVARFKVIVFQALEKTPKLRNCTKESFLSAIMQAAELELEPNTPLGHGWLIPYGTEATFQIGYKGLIFQAMRCGAVSDIRAGVRYKGEPFQFRPLHPTEPILHERNIDDPRSRNQKMTEILGFYSVAYLPSGLVKAEYMTKADVDAIRARSRAKDDGPWVTDYVPMGLKSAIKRQLQYSPLAGEMPRLVKTIELDESQYRPVECEHDFTADHVCSKCDALQPPVQLSSVPASGKAAGSESASQAKDTPSQAATGAGSAAAPLTEAEIIRRADDLDCMARSLNIKASRVRQLCTGVTGQPDLYKIREREHFAEVEDLIETEGVN